MTVPRPGGAGAARSARGVALALSCCLAAAGAGAQEIIPAEPAPPPSSFLKYWPFLKRQAAPASAPAYPAAPAASQPQPETHAPAGAATPAASAARPASADGLSWSSLTPAQRVALEPLAREWSSLDASRRQKWLEIADRLPRMSPEKRERMQERMTEWARMTPQQRAKVRLHFQEARQVAPVNRKESWDAYLALPPEQRRQLAERAALPASAPAARPAPGAAAQKKSNIVVPADLAGAPRPVAPTVVQAQPGATTTLMSRRPAPPGHQQAGLPKIAATPEFVDRTTLLPQRGAQGAAIRPVAASEPASRR